MFDRQDKAGPQLCPKYIAVDVVTNMRRGVLLFLLAPV